MCGGGRRISFLCVVLVGELVVEVGQDAEAQGTAEAQHIEEQVAAIALQVAEGEFEVVV